MLTRTLAVLLALFYCMTYFDHEKNWFLTMNATYGLLF